MTQPSFVPVSAASTVRPTMPTETPEIGRAKKPGLLGAPGSGGGDGRGTPGPDAGFALTLAERALHHVTLSAGESHHDVEVALAIVAAKRAGLVGRGPTKSDVTVACELFGVGVEAATDVVADRVRRFAGLGHSYFLQRAFADAIPVAALQQEPGHVTPLIHFS